MIELSKRIVCDRCGREIGSGPYLEVATGPIRRAFSTPEDRAFQYCQECERVVMATLEGWANEAHGVR